MQKLSVILVVGCVALGTSLWAQEDDVEFSSSAAGTATPVSTFESADRDADGKISMEEFRNRMTKVFFELDADGDGVLQESEFSQVLVAPHHELADSDSSNTVSHKEFMGHTILLFETVDTNGDGHFTKEELAAAGHEKEDR